MNPMLKDQLRLELSCYLRDAAALLEAAAEMSTPTIRNDTLRSAADVVAITQHRIAAVREQLKAAQS